MPPTLLKARVLLADDHEVVRSRLRMVLDAEPDPEMVAEVGDGAEAVARVLEDDIYMAIIEHLDAAHDRTRGGRSFTLAVPTGGS
jgi:DNA-binding NarL/FixJ family response regulator